MRKMMLLVVVVLVGAALLLAQPQARAGGPCTVPKSWGALRGITNFALPMSGEQTRLAFEDDAGTVRILTDSCKTAFEVTRIP